MWKIPEEFRHSFSIFGSSGAPYGAFKCESPTRQGYELLIIASPGGVIDDDNGGERTINWEHVSVHAGFAFVGDQRTATPTWDEMDYVKGLFWDAADVVMQLHINDGEKVDTHKHTLHLWRPTDREIPVPDKDLV